LSFIAAYDSDALFSSLSLRASITSTAITGNPGYLMRREPWSVPANETITLTEPSETIDRVSILPG
jgi:hypothetical protein